MESVTLQEFWWKFSRGFRTNFPWNVTRFLLQDFKNTFFTEHCRVAAAENIIINIEVDQYSPYKNTWKTFAKALFIRIELDQ